MSLDQSLNKILIIDFGSQFTQLIARRIRELGVFSEIVSHKKIKNNYIDSSVKGIILSGGPLNVYEINKYSFDKKIIENKIQHTIIKTESSAKRLNLLTLHSASFACTKPGLTGSRTTPPLSS